MIGLFLGLFFRHSLAGPTPVPGQTRITPDGNVRIIADGVSIRVIN